MTSYILVRSYLRPPLTASDLHDSDESFRLGSAKSLWNTISEIIGIIPHSPLITIATWSRSLKIGSDLVLDRQPATSSSFWSQTSLIIFLAHNFHLCNFCFASSVGQGTIRTSGQEEWTTSHLGNRESQIPSFAPERKCAGFGNRKWGDEESKEYDMSPSKSLCFDAVLVSKWPFWISASQPDARMPTPKKSTSIVLYALTICSV